MAAHPVTALRTPSRGSTPAPAPPAVALRGVTLGNEAAPVLRGLDLQVARGETLVLLGPAGAGKTSVLELVGGFARPSAGEILLDGRPAAGVKPHRRGLGLVLCRDGGPLGRMTVAGTIGFALASREAAGGWDAVGAIMQAFGLAGLGDRHGHDLDPEQRLRTALARALVGRPRLVLLDEAFTGLDTAARELVLADLLPVLAASGAACVLATRDPVLALALGGRAAVLDEGALRQVGPVQAIYDAPACESVARLLGEANCLPGRVDTIEQDTALVRLECGVVVEVSAEGAVPGRACVVVVRPERIAVAAGTLGEMGAGALPATVTTLAWRGDHVRLTLAIGVAEPATLVVRRPAGAPLAGLAPGQTAVVAWQPRHARALV